jgi:hypothetical protein
MAEVTRIDNRSKRLHRRTMKLALLPALLLVATSALAQAQEPAAAADPAVAFSAMLTNATLNGTWAPVDKRLLGANQDDKYHIVRATRKEGDRWEIVSRMKIQGQAIDFPIPVTIQFAGDAAVMILDNVPIGAGQTWSARILFLDDVYAGSWWGKDKAAKSGIVSGTITREKSE